MPEEYEKIKQSYLDKGKSKEEAERIAAATYNKNIRKHKKDDRPIGNKAQQEAGSAVSEDDEDLLDAIVEFIDDTEPDIELRSGKDIFFEEFINNKLKAILEAYDLSSLTGDDASGVFKAGFNGGGIGRKNPYPAGHTLAKIWDAGAAAAREVDAAWAKKSAQPKQSAAKIPSTSANGFSI